MIRKQIYLTPVLNRELAIAARREGKSEAAVIREILELKLQLKKINENPAAVLLKLAQHTFKGPGDLSANLTRYLYGDKSPNYGRRKKTIHRR